MGIIFNSCLKGNVNQKANIKIEKGNNKIQINDESCYTCKAEIIKRPEIGNDDFTIQINAEHKGDHSCDVQILFIVFNYPVTFISCSNGNLISSNDTTRIRVKLTYHNEPNDKIEIGDFNVKSPNNDLEIVECSITDNHSNN